MSSPSAFDAFKERLDTYSTLPVRFENDFAQDLLDANTAAWVYVEIFGDRFDQETMGAPGANVWMEEGMTYLHVMVPSGAGSRDARIHANELVALFREQPIGGLFMPEMSIGAGDPGRDFPNYWALTVTIRWTRADITNI